MCKPNYLTKIKDINFLFFLLLLAFSCQNKPQKSSETVGAIRKKDFIVLPFADTLSNNWIIVKASINDKPAYLLLDNGTGSTTELIIYKHYAASTGIIDTLKPFGLEVDRIEKLPIPIFINDLCDTLNAELHAVNNAPVKKMPDGILGKGFLTKYFIEIDYNNKLLKLHDTFSFRVPDRYKPILLKPIGMFYKFNATFFIDGNSINEDVFLDLGSGWNGLYFGNKYYKKYKTILKIDINKTHKSYTMFSKSNNAETVIDSVTIGHWKIKNVSSAVEVETTSSSIPLIIGNAVLRQAGKVIFDLRNNKMYLPIE